MEFSTKGGGVRDGRFLTKKKEQKNTQYNVSDHDQHPHPCTHIQRPRGPCIPKVKKQNSNTKKTTWAKNTGFCIKIILRQTYFFQFKRHLVFSILGWGDPFQLGSRSAGWIKLQTSLEKPSDKCQRTHIIQNSFHDA